LKQRSF